MNPHFTVCKIKIDKNNYLKLRTVCKSCCKKIRKNNNNALIQNEIITSQQRPKIENGKNNKNNVTNPNVSTYESHVIGPRNVYKTFYMLKILEQKSNKRLIHIITRSPNKYPNYKTSNELNQYLNTKSQLLFLMKCQEHETVLK